MRVSSPAEGPRSTAAICAACPFALASRASLRHVARPMPLAAPVTSARMVSLRGGQCIASRPRTAGGSARASEGLLQPIQPVRGQRVLDRIDDLVAVLLIEEGGLEAVGVEREPGAATSLRFRFRGREEARAVSVAAQILAHPERLNLADAAPAPAVEAGGDRPIPVAHEEGQPAPVVEAGLLDVVEIELILQEPDVLRPWL